MTYFIGESGIRFHRCPPQKNQRSISSFWKQKQTLYYIFYDKISNSKFMKMGWFKLLYNWSGWLYRWVSWVGLGPTFEDLTNKKHTQKKKVSIFFSLFLKLSISVFFFNTSSNPPPSKVQRLQTSKVTLLFLSLQM